LVPQTALLGRGLLSIGAALVLAAAPASAQQRLVTIKAPSAHVDPTSVAFNGDDHPRELRANVLLPDGYNGERRFPVLYLLHGVGDSYASWSNPERGDILDTARGFRGIIVMPEADRGFYANWWNDGGRGDPGWERYYLDELIPLVERRFRIREGRRWHAVAGLSMGGLGSTFFATQKPGYFGAAASFSGFVSHQRPEVPPVLPIAAGASYEEIFGPPDAFYATGHNPTRLTDNLRHTRLYVAVGDGTPEPGAGGSPSPLAAALEAGLRPQSGDLVAAARTSGVDTTYRPHRGIHDWPYWRRDLRDAIAWGFFAPVPATSTDWTYRTAAGSGDMWGFEFVFRAAPEELITFTRTGDRLAGTGSGTASIRTPAGCSITVSVPFERELPRTCTAARAVTIRARVTPRATSAGRRTRFRFRASTPTGPLAGASVRFAGRRVRTGRRGTATMLARLRAGRYRARFTSPGLRPATVTVRVRPAARSPREPRLTG
jgi:S-formylglutathione hydrolase FrmB